MTIAIKPIGKVASRLIDPSECPKQANEGAPGARLEFHADILAGLQNLRPGDRLILLTWLHRAKRDTLVCRPRDDALRAERGVFSTRSGDRPNPIGLHEVKVTAIDLPFVDVDQLEVIDGTPIIDVKPVLAAAFSVR
jgi:tRNA-Thr(GGU) m(6)t(6)A37 methyltransferase TsaA